MDSSSNLEFIEDLSKQCEKYIESDKKLIEMIKTEKSEKEWKENYHVIDHDWVIKWKDLVSFDSLVKENYDQNYNNIFNYIKTKNIQINKIDKLNNQSIYYVDNDKYLVNPMKTYDIITDDVYRLLDKNNENSKFNGKVSILKGNKKIIVRFDENNYLVKYLANDEDNLFGEFVIEFPPQNEYKNNILNDLAVDNINKWMKEIEIKYSSIQFTIDKYKNKSTKFNIKQKTNNNYIENTSFIDSLIKSNFSFSYSSSFMSSNELSKYFDDISNYRYIQKIEQTSNVCSVMRCFSFIEPFAEYFMGNIKSFRIFGRFQSKSFLNLIRDFFLNLWSNEKTPYGPRDLISYIKDKEILNIKDEQDPFIFLNYFIDFINKELNNYDVQLKFNFNNIADELRKESFYGDLVEIIKNNNSIVSKYFFGLMLEKYKCDNCSKNFEKVKELKIIDIEYREIMKYFNDSSGISVVKIDIDDFLDYYFLRKEIDNIPKISEPCPHCKKNAKIVKKEMLEYPPYLLIRLNRGEFEEKKGFVNNIDIPDININYEIIKYINTFCSNKIKKYNNIMFEYELICLINYINIDKIRFSSICKFISNVNKNIWISFLCNSAPKQLSHSYKNDISKPYILFYKLNKK